MDRTTLIENLGKHMEENNLSKTKLAEEIGINIQTLSKLLSIPTYKIQRPLAEKLARFFNCDICEFGYVFKTTDTPDNDFKTYKNHVIDIAKDFNYGYDVYKELESAKTVGELNRIMATARHKKFG